MAETMSDARTATIDQYSTYLSIYLSCVCFHCTYCFDCSYSLTRRICLFCSSKQSIIKINNGDTSAIKSIANTPFLPSANGTLHQQQQLQLERDPTMVAMAIVTRRQQHSNRGTRAPIITTMAIAKYNVCISNNNRTMPDAHNSNSTTNAIHQLNPSTTQTMERGEGCGIANGLDRGRGVGNGLDRGRVDVVLDEEERVYQIARFKYVVHGRVNNLTHHGIISSFTDTPPI